MYQYKQKYHIMFLSGNCKPSKLIVLFFLLVFKSDIETDRFQDVQLHSDEMNLGPYLCTGMAAVLTQVTCQETIKKGHT